MLKIGQLNTLKVVKEVDFGFYLDGLDYGEILLPTRYVPEGLKPDDSLEVFIYFDSEDRIIATTEKPLAMVGEFALLKAVSVTRYGAFLNWGLMKDLFVPYREQKEEGLEVDKNYAVYVYFDKESKRIAASTKLDKFLSNDTSEFEANQEVKAFVVGLTDLGYKAIVNNSTWGLIYKNEVFKNIQRGKTYTAYIKQVRPDSKLDLTLSKIGYGKIEDFSSTLLNYIQKNGGSINLTDKSPADKIYSTFQVSKRVFKMAVGKLYKSKKITITKDSISLTDS